MHPNPTVWVATKTLADQPATPTRGAHRRAAIGSEHGLLPSTDQPNPRMFWGHARLQACESAPRMHADMQNAVQMHALSAPGRGRFTSPPERTRVPAGAQGGPPPSFGLYTYVAASHCTRAHQ